MPFPDRGRVVYRRNPLEEVICQVRFPPVLKIDAEVPAGFQDRIRDEYPLYREPETSIQLPAAMPQQLVQMLQSRLTGGAVTRQFLTADEAWSVTLNREFLALATKQYRRWEEFERHLTGPLNALIAEFSPVFLARIGLRYRNLLRRSAFGMADADWQQLLAPHIACELQTDVHGNVEEAAHQVLVRLKDVPGQVRIRHGLGRADDGEAVYSIDSDFFLEQKAELKDVHQILAEFNKRARRAFRWCVTDLLHERMEPDALQ
jgi:uncharacterized protein (TIGR04255 family)